MRLLPNAAAISLSVLMVSSAAAQSPTAASSAQMVTNDQAINIVAEKLCKGEPVVGTRLAKRRKCDTPAQLAQYREQAREMIENFRHRPCAMGAEAGENKPMTC